MLYILKQAKVYILKLSFPKGEPFTLSEAQKWCEVENKYTIRRVCEKYFRSTNKNPKKYYKNQ